MQDRRTRRRRVYVFVFIVILLAALYLLLLQPRQTTAQALDASVTHAWVA